MAWNSNDDDLKVDSDFRSLISFFNDELFNLNHKKARYAIYKQNDWIQSSE